MLLHFLKFECKTEEKECVRLLPMKNSGMRIMDVHVSTRCTLCIVVISFKSHWFWVMIPWLSADYLCWVYYCTWSCCVHVPRVCRDLTSALLRVLQAATRQDMTYWLQELQQKRWEYCNNLDAAKRDSRTSPTPSDFSKGLVAKDNPGMLETWVRTEGMALFSVSSSI